MMDSNDFNNQPECSFTRNTFRARSQSITEYLGARWRRVSMSDDDVICGKRRLVAKNGDRNIIQTDIHRRGHSYLADIFVTLVDTRWRFILLMFLSGFILSWIAFALLWWLILLARGDFNHVGDNDWTPCVDEVVDFPTALLFSIETQHTIGYGSRATTSKCPEAIILMMLQSVGGTLMTAILTGIVFSKIQRPKRRSQTLIFSKNAVVCMREGNLCLLFRVGDMRREHMIGTHIRAIKVKKSVTKEGEVLPLCEQDVAFHVPPNGVLFLVWPAMACHIIDKNSPFYHISKEDLKRDKFELIVIMEGIIESTGMTTQVRTSYLPSEILWGHRFRRLTMYQKDTGEYQIRYNNFHSSVPVDTPSCSVREMTEYPDIAMVSTTYYQSDNEETIPQQHVPTYPPIPSFNRSVSFEEQGNTVHEDSDFVFEDIDSEITESSKLITTDSSDQTTSEQVTDPNITKLTQVRDEDLNTPLVLKRSKGNKVFTIEKSKNDPYINKPNPPNPGIIKFNASKMGSGNGTIPNKLVGRKVRSTCATSDKLGTHLSGKTQDLNLNDVTKATEKNTLKNRDLITVI
ncbi:unnamed protein product [Owenia fusiformis]|uniref:G protein-activated inward rectifier potassium channel 3 n=1 Tax=Owenia fusiformis TaxID=6347 RepID=A0A8J1ULT0_OWEFU|nr:unnamed protein product [Owenia fusiformis]